MRPLRILGLLLALLGLCLIGFGIFTGELQVALFIIFPLVYGQGLLGAAGIFLIFLGFVVFFLSFSVETAPSRKEASGDESPPAEREKSRFGGVVFIGPIPIVFGSGKELLRNRWFLASIVAIAAIMLILIVIVIFL